MKYWRGHPRIRQSLGCLLIALTPGCTSWKTVNKPVPECLAEDKPDRVRVTFAATGEILELKKPGLVTDSLVGMDSARTRTAVPLAAIKSMAVRRTSAGKTVLLIGGVTVLLASAAAAAAAIALSNSDMGFSCSESSCPWIYAWDGTAWQLESGTFGGAITRGAARTDLDNLEFAVPRRNSLRLKLANQLNETDHVDEVTVLAVDHGPGLTILPTPDGIPISVLAPLPPVRARDFRGADALPAIRSSDGWAWETNPTGRDPTRLEDLRDGLELTFVRPAGAIRAKLVVEARNTPWAALMLERFLALHGPGLDAWYDSLDANPDMRREVLGRLAEEGFLQVSVWRDGSWRRQGAVWEVGPELNKRQVLVLDLRGIEGPELRVRLASAPSFWSIESVGLDYSDDVSMTIRRLAPLRAIDHAGNNVVASLAARDDSMLTLNQGEWAELEYRVPEPPFARVRTWMVETSGWYRIHLRPARVARSELLQLINTDRLMGAKLSTTWMNQTIRALDEPEF
ncbi:MAG TPA: hypothetical protein VGA78_04145 [Gemmatimonadales bacterium]